MRGGVRVIAVEHATRFAVGRIVASRDAVHEVLVLDVAVSRETMLIGEERVVVRRISGDAGRGDRPADRGQRRIAAGRDGQHEPARHENGAHGAR